jgi:hypothetical protein
LVAAGIAGVRYWQAGMEATKLILPIVLLPFLFVFAPQLLIGVGQDTTAHFLFLLVSVAVSFIVINFGTAGWLGAPLNLSWRLLLVAIGLATFAGIYLERDPVIGGALIVGIGALATGTGYSILLGGRLRRDKREEPIQEWTRRAANEDASGTRAERISETGGSGHGQHE